jgi:hypothetical protein
VLKFAKLSIEERQDFFQEVANRRSLRPLIVEKDFWVCFILRILFENPDLSENLILKGGTSLSKIFKITKRFSEDIDLSVNPGWLGFDGENHPEVALSKSRSQFDKKCKDLNKACITAVKEMIQPILECTICDLLGLPNSGEDFLSFEIDTQINSAVLWFHYPTQEYKNKGFIKPRVKLELGSLLDQNPFDTYSSTSWVAEDFPSEFREPKFKVISIEPERTFWEKTTILHAEYHKPKDKPMRNHLSRDIYDICIMANHEYGKKALQRLDIRESVVEYKKKYFYSKWASYETANPGTFRLVPPSHRHSDLTSDYLKMNEMFFETPPTFDELLDQLSEIEKIINLS